MMVDIGCGSGQSTLPWSGIFKKCVGIDLSEAQIACAQEKVMADNVEFRVCPSDKLPFDSGSVDLVTCGQAWHWLDLSSTIPEIQRVLRRGGCVAVFGYGRSILKNPQAEDLVNKFYSVTLKGYWHSNRVHVDQFYKGLPMVYPPAVEQVFNVNKTMTFSDFFGYLNTWSGYITYNEQNPGNSALETLRDNLEEVITGDAIEMVTPYFLYLSRKD